MSSQKDYEQALRTLRARLCLLDKERNAILQLLEIGEASTDTGGIVTPTGELGNDVAPKRHARGKGLGAVLLRVLDEADGPLTSNDVFARIEKYSFRFNQSAKVDPKRRVSNELWRLARVGQIDKKEAGTFQAKKK